MERLSLDTNILVYAADRDAGSKREVARELLSRAARTEGVLTQQVIGEFLNVACRMPDAGRKRLRSIAQELCLTFPVLSTPRELLFEAYGRAARFKLQYWDCVIASVCIANGVRWLVSEDLQDGLIMDGLEILNPFLPGNSARLLKAIGDGTPD